MFTRLYDMAIDNTHLPAAALKGSAEFDHYKLQSADGGFISVVHASPLLLLFNNISMLIN
jgi:hypothetical protein